MRYCPHCAVPSSVPELSCTTHEYAHELAEPMRAWCLNLLQLAAMELTVDDTVGWVQGWGDDTGRLPFKNLPPSNLQPPHNWSIRIIASPPTCRQGAYCRLPFKHLPPSNLQPPHNWSTRIIASPPTCRQGAYRRLPFRNIPPSNLQPPHN